MRTIESRSGKPNGALRRRRRECTVCNARFTTLEVVADTATGVALAKHRSGLAAVRNKITALLSELEVEFPQGDENGIGEPLVTKLHDEGVRVRRGHDA